jgi:alpha-1,3-glucosyltransferase
MAASKDRGKKVPRLWSNSGALAVFALALCFKVLLFVGYRSTDFEVHRNWLAITHSLPLSQWYVDETSEWTLDYPPLFAWFEYALSQVGQYLDPGMVVVSNLNHASEATVIFQRATVVVTEAVLIFAVYLFSKRTKPAFFTTLLFLVALNPGLLIVDHTHFQYNGLLLGIFMLSLEAMQRDQILVSAFLFAVLLNMKHLFAVAAPYYFTYMLRRYCVGATFKQALGRFLLLGSVVLFVCCLSIGPFIHNGTVENLLERLFPFGRGLCHAYWAPNFWALYSFADKVLVKLAKLLGIHIAGVSNSGHLAGGLVGVTAFGVLPQVTPLATLVMVVLSMAPCLVRAWAKPKPSNILQDLAYVNLCGFMFGYHVHEKAVLHFVIPMAFSALLSKSGALEYAAISWPSYISLMPLLYRSEEHALKQIVVLLYCTCVSCLFSSQAFSKAAKKERLPMKVAGGASSRRLPSSSATTSRLWSLYVVLLVCVQVYCNAGHSFLFGTRYGFLPLLLSSVTSAVGLFAWFCQQFLAYAM